MTSKRKAITQPLVLIALYSLTTLACFNYVFHVIEGDRSVNGITVDSEILGLVEGEPLMSARGVQAMIESFGDPVATIKVTLPGHSAVEADGGWTNADAYLMGNSESAEYVWRPGSPESVSLLISRQDGSVACHEYCQNLDPIGLWLDGDVYPNCTCDCGPGNAFFAKQCISCDMLYTGEGQSVIDREGQPFGCLCEDPTEKWEPSSGECVAITVDGCNLRDRCQPELGENCLTCPDCNCGFAGDDNFLVNSQMRCEP